MARYLAYSRFIPLGRDGLIWIGADSFSDGDELSLGYAWGPTGPRHIPGESARIIKASPDELTLELNGKSFKLRPWRKGDGWVEYPRDAYGFGPEWEGPSSKWTVK